MKKKTEIISITIVCLFFIKDFGGEYIKTKDFIITIINYQFIEKLLLFFLIYVIVYIMTLFISDILSALKDEDNKTQNFGAVLFGITIILLCLAWFNASGYLQTTLSIESFDSKIREAIKTDNWKIFLFFITILFSSIIFFSVLKFWGDKDWVKVFIKMLILGAIPIVIFFQYVLIPYTLAFIIGIMLASSMYMIIYGLKHDEDDI